jgi:hypothetical protein
MKKYTGTVILTFIALVFGVDAILSTGQHATISEFAHNFLKDDPLIGFTVLIGSFATLIAHFWWFRPKE